MATMQGDVAEPEQETSPQVSATQHVEVIGDYEILGKLGQGGMGAVYRARQLSLDRVVALKILPSQMQDDENFVGRFQREAQVAAGLNHPNLVRVYCSGISDGCHYIAMELVEGKNLRQRLKHGPMSNRDALRICLDVARGLQCGWQRAQLIHRDVKPSNIYLSQAGEVKLGDLGLAKSLASNTTGLTHAGTAIGTPHYISPEQARGDKSIDFRADIYSLGCTLYELLTRSTPYHGTDPLTVMNMHINAAPPAILKALPQCPLPLARLVSKMMRKSRHERHQTYEELIAAMEGALHQLEQGPAAPGASLVVAAWRQIGDAGQHGVAVREATPAPSSPLKPPPAWPAKPRRGRWLAVVVGVVLLAGAAVLAFIFWPKPVPLTQAQIHLAQRQAGARAPATVGNATKENPYENALGMKFVPVAITGGPTDGQRVLFSIWETRVQDYEVFATETKREWQKSGFEQGPTHPAVRVSWDDAQAYCAWLTERERKAGRLGANEQYRLPSDHEWICAVGIGEREDAAKQPNEKDQKIPDVFPWGSAWPPPAQAGNYAGEELQPVLAAGQHPGFKGVVIPGYRDGYAETAPAGSFPANRFGLYDLGGNASEWCEDWYDSQQERRVMRGASWNSGVRAPLLSSRRSHAPPGTRSGDLGFRSVVGISAPSPRTGAGKPEAAGQTGAAAVEPGVPLSTYPQPPKWTDTTAAFGSERLASGVLVAEGDWLKATRDFTGNVSGSTSLRNPILRVLFSERVTLDLRRVNKDGHDMYYSGEIGQGYTSIHLYAATNSNLVGRKLDSPDRLDGEHEGVFAAQADTLTLWLDGKVVAIAHDNTLTEGGIAVGFQKDSSLIKRVEYGELPEAPPAAGRLSPSAEPWQDVLRDPARLDLPGTAERTPEGLRFTDSGSAYLRSGQGPKRDGAVRMLATFGDASVRLCARAIPGVRSYRLNPNDEKRIDLGSFRKLGQTYTTIRVFPLRAPLKPGQDYELELRVVGQTLTAKLNGEVLGTVTDGAFPEGQFGVEVGARNGAPTLIKALEVLDLDAAGASGAQVPR